MKASRKKNHWRRRTHQGLTGLIGLAFLGFFLLVWQVHAFDLQKVLPKSSGEVTESAVQTSKLPPTARVEVDRAPALATPPAPATPSGPLSKPDRWSDGDVVSALSSFYQTIITMMGLLLGIIGILAVITLRFLSKTAAEDIAHEAADKAMARYMESRQFGDNVKYAIEEIGLAYQLENLEEDIDSIKAILKKSRRRPAAGRYDEDADGDVVPGDWSEED